DDVSDPAAVALLGDRAAAVPQNDLALLAMRARQNVDLAARQDQARGLRRLPLRKDQRPLALRQTHGVPAAAEVAGTLIFFRARTGPLRQNGRGKCHQDHDSPPSPERWACLLRKLDQSQANVILSH